jgi:hypothetical protein
VAKSGKVNVSKKTQGETERPLRYHVYKYLILIVCEDGRTEPYYFQQFVQEIPPETMHLHPVGAGLDPQGVVERACIERDELAARFRRSVDETWVVFDKDDADRDEGKKRRFIEALRLAEENNFRLAFSNEVFELWLLLHLTDVEAIAPIPRTDIYTRLGEELRKHPTYQHFQYAHGKVDIIDAIRAVGDESAAIQRAQALAATHTDKELLAMNPSTQVHELVRELRAQIQFYSWQPEKKTRVKGSV